MIAATSLFIAIILTAASCVGPEQDAPGIFCSPSAHAHLERLLGREVDNTHLKLQGILATLAERNIPHERIIDGSLPRCNAKGATIFYQIYAGTDRESQTIIKIAANESGDVLAIAEIVMIVPRL
jgi:hypothetical protein